MSLKGKQVLVTGAAGGIGSRIVPLLRNRGAIVTGLDRTEAPGADDWITGDLGTLNGLQALTPRLRHQHFDTLVNLAGLQHFGPVEDQSPEHTFTSYVVNLIAPVMLTQAVLPWMKRRGAGHIVNIGSIFGSINFAHFATYSSAKAGLKGFSEALRREVGDLGIHVTYIAPRAVKTPFNTGKVLEFAKITNMNMDDPDLITARIVSAIEARAKTVYLGFPESLFVRINAIAPGLVDLALAGNDRKARLLFEPQATTTDRPEEFVK